MSTLPPGWFHAAGDPPNTQRYWNGTSWDGAPRPVTMPPPSQSMVWPENSAAVGALVMSCLGLLLCFILSPIGMTMAAKERKAIDAGLRDPANRKLAEVAYWLGLGGTVVIIAMVVFIAGLFLFGGFMLAIGAIEITR